MNDLPEKRCARCKVKKALTDFHKDKSKKDGLCSYCKVCNCKTTRNYAKANPEKTQAYTKAWYKANAESVKKRVKIHAKNNREKIRVYSKSWREAHKEYSRKQYRVWFELNRQRVKANCKAWYLANPERVGEHCRRRRARKRNAQGAHTAADVARQFSLQGGCCYWCGAKLEKSGKRKFHVDHREPLSKGGSDGPENIVCACPTCNLSKGAKTPLEFAGRLF